MSSGATAEWEEVIVCLEPYGNAMGRLGSIFLTESDECTTFIQVTLPDGIEIRVKKRSGNLAGTVSRIRCISKIQGTRLVLFCLYEIKADQFRQPIP